MLYVIYAADDLYHGYHGMVDWSIEDCKNEKEALEIAKEKSLEVINTYSTINNELNYYVDDILSDDIYYSISEEEKEDLRNEIYLEDVEYNVYEIDADIAKKYDIDYLEKMLNRNPEDFIEKYCDY